MVREVEEGQEEGWRQHIAGRHDERANSGLSLGWCTAALSTLTEDALGVIGSRANVGLCRAHCCSRHVNRASIPLIGGNKHACNMRVPTGEQAWH